MNKLNCFYPLFNHCYRPGIRALFTYQIPYFFKSIVFGFQRAFRGYSDWDTWNLDKFYINLFIGSLRHFAKYVNGWPDNLYETFEDYVKDINRVADDLEYYIKDNSEDNEYWEEYSEILMSTMRTEKCVAGRRVFWDMNNEQKEIKEKYFNRMFEIEEEKEILLNDCMLWLSEHMRNLWW